MLDEVHVKLYRITNLDLEPKMTVVWLRKAHVLQRAQPQEKVPAGNDEFCLRALCTRQLQMLLLRRKEITGLSVKIDEYVKIASDDVSNFVVKGMKSKD